MLTKTDRHGLSTLNSGRSERNGDLFQSLTLDALLNGACRHQFGYESRDLFGRILRAVVPGARQAKHLAVRERLAEQWQKMLGMKCPVSLAPDCQRDGRSCQLYCEAVVIELPPPQGQRAV